MSTAISNLITPLRFILGDTGIPDGESVDYEFNDAALADALRSAVMLNELRGFELTSDQNFITPVLSDPNKFALLVFKTARLMRLVNPDDYAFRSRAYTERIAGYKTFIRELQFKIYKLENGTMFNGWQSFYAFVSGVYGLPLAQVMTEMTVDAPFASVSLSASGVNT